MNETIVVEYVELCARLASFCARLASLDADAGVEAQHYGRLDELWYVEMTAADRAEAEKRLTVIGNKDRAWHDARRTEDP